MIKNVRQAWSEYYHALCVKDPDEIQLKQMQQAQDKLLEKMAISLGYKDKITWETIQNPYVPKGMMEAMDQQQIIQKGQTELAKVAGAFAQMINTNAANQAPNRQEDKSPCQHLNGLEKISGKPPPGGALSGAGAPVQL